MLSTDTGTDTIDATEGNWAGKIACGHVKRLGGRVDHVVNRLQSEVEGHEFDDRTQAFETSTDGDTREACLSDWSVPDTITAISIPHALRDLVSSVVLSNFFTDQENTWVSFDLIAHCTVNRLSHRHLVIVDRARCERTADSHALQESYWPLRFLDGVLHHPDRYFYYKTLYKTERSIFKP